VDGLNLNGKVAVVTGAGSGIGKAIAKRFAAHGALVRALDIDAKAVNATVEEIKLAGGCAHVSVCDVTNAENVGSTFSSTAVEGPIDVLVNSAGLAHVGTIATTMTADFDRIFKVNVTGVYLCMQAAIATMATQLSGTILNLASTAASTGIPDRFAYSMSKGAVRAMTFSVAKDYLDKNIRCNCVSPARVHTPFVDGFVRKNYPGREEEMFGVLSRSQPIGRMATPDEVAVLALYLCSDFASFITGADFPFDGGFFNLRD
jgi:NAD(P)-dependent dehydrogenase (short-subunit alcohol dehydrogenase family)